MNFCTWVIDAFKEYVTEYDVEGHLAVEVVIW